MKHVQTARLRRRGFQVLHRTRASQAATMTIRPGQSSSEDSRNEHRWAEQWLYVVAGTGTARVSGRSVRLREGSLLLIGKREPHVIRNTGRSDLVTVNIYAPPAYRTDGDPLA
ncbi:MAG TPA: cupin domain-containing protein [Kofleriaceae bacterium]|jgi:mannose-6-phosphate isomerase-like protein (cupin superfamily)|nr:cupin domain-containing protein [Kofleriaceae bacterium]